MKSACGWACLLLVAAVCPAPTSAQSVTDFTLQEVWRFGAVDPVPGHELAGPFIAIAVAPDGTVAVLDQALVSVTLLRGSDGGFIRRIARPGQGPGELGGPVALAWDDVGHLWVDDQRNRRYNVYDANGEWLRDVPRPSGSANRRVFPILVTDAGEVMDHDGGGERIRFFAVDSLGAVRSETSVPQPVLPKGRGVTGILRPGTPLTEALAFRPTLRWTLSPPEPAIWIARTDSLTLVKLSLAGDTLRRIEADHRRAEFTREQRELIRRANREVGYDGGFAPIVLQALHGMSDGRVLVQIADGPAESGREMDLFDGDGRFLGTVHTPFPIYRHSALDSRGDTLFVHAEGRYDTPFVVEGGDRAAPLTPLSEGRARRTIATLGIFTVANVARIHDSGGDPAVESCSVRSNRAGRPKF